MSKDSGGQVKKEKNKEEGGEGEGVKQRHLLSLYIIPGSSSDWVYGLELGLLPTPGCNGGWKVSFHTWEC